MTVVTTAQMIRIRPTTEATSAFTLKTEAAVYATAITIVIQSRL